MNANSFMVFPNKPRSVKLNARNLRELHMETVQLNQENKDMETRLQELRETMSLEKVERGKFRWKSAHSHKGVKNKERLFEKNANSKMKIKVLKDEPFPVERMPEPPPKDGKSRKSRLKRKVCGQCEAQTAGLVCTECGEDYCVSCFARFHQKGALKFHHMTPIQAELHTSISSVDVVHRFQTKRREEEEEEEEAGSVWWNPSDGGITDHNETHNTKVLLVNDGVEIKEDEEGEEGDDEDDEGSLFRGQFDEDESARSFQKAVMQWRAANTHTERKQQSDCMVQTPPAGGVGETWTKANGEPSPSIHIEFRDHGLNYMEKLLLKKHRRTPLASCQLRPTPTRHSVTPPAEENLELTAQEMDLHRYCISLFTVSGSAGAEERNNLPQSYTRNNETDETAEGPLVDATAQLKPRDDTEKLSPEEEKSLDPSGRILQSSSNRILNSDRHLADSPNLQVPRTSSPKADYKNSVDWNSSLFISQEEQNDDNRIEPLDLPQRSLTPSQFSQSSRLADALKPQNPVKSPAPKAESVLNVPSPQSHRPLLSLSAQIQPPRSPVPPSPELNMTPRERYYTRSTQMPLPRLSQEQEEKTQCSPRQISQSPLLYQTPNPDLHERTTSELTDLPNPNIPRTPCLRVKYFDSLELDSSFSISQEDQDDDSLIKTIDSFQQSLTPAQFSQPSRVDDVLKPQTPKISSALKASSMPHISSHQSHSPLLSTPVQIQSPVFPVFRSPKVGVVSPIVHHEISSLSHLSNLPQAEEEKSLDASHLTPTKISTSGLYNIPKPPISRTPSPKAKHSDSKSWDFALSISKEEPDNSDQIKPMDSLKQSLTPSQFSQPSSLNNAPEPQMPGRSALKARSILNPSSPCSTPQSHSPLLSTSVPNQLSELPVSSSPNPSRSLTDWIQTNPVTLNLPLFTPSRPQTPRISSPPQAVSTLRSPEETPDRASPGTPLRADELGLASWILNPSRSLKLDKVAVPKQPPRGTFSKSQNPRRSSQQEATLDWDATPTPSCPSSQSHTPLLPMPSPAFLFETSAGAPRPASRSPSEEASSEDENSDFSYLGSKLLQESPPSPQLSLSDFNVSRESTFLLPSDDEDSSDEETRRTERKVEEDRSASSFPRLSQSGGWLGMFTEPSPPPSSLAPRHSSVSRRYGGPDGFPRHTHSTHTESFITGESARRPSSNLRHPSEAELMNQPTNAASRSGWRPNQSDPFMPTVSRPLTATRPVSCAALEILEVQTVEREALALSEPDEEEEDQLALHSLEEELKRISADPQGREELEKQNEDQSH